MSLTHSAMFNHYYGLALKEQATSKPLNAAVQLLSYHMTHQLMIWWKEHGDQSPIECKTTVSVTTMPPRDPDSDVDEEWGHFFDPLVGSEHSHQLCKTENWNNHFHQLCKQQPGNILWFT